MVGPKPTLVDLSSRPGYWIGYTPAHGKGTTISPKKSRRFPFFEAPHAWLWRCLTTWKSDWPQTSSDLLFSPLFHGETTPIPLRGYLSSNHPFPVLSHLFPSFLSSVSQESGGMEGALVCLLVACIIIKSGLLVFCLYAARRVPKSCRTVPAGLGVSAVLGSKSWS
jgi:hypothetical protein